MYACAEVAGLVVEFRQSLKLSYLLFLILIYVEELRWREAPKPFSLHQVQQTPNE